jgi:tetraacyldisaccharide 4'-kinase
VSVSPRAWLAPLGALYGAIGSARVALYGRGVLSTARLRGPVISVGNLAVGGRGKTPVVALVAEWVRDAGLPVAVLSRGYGGRFEGEALWVSDGERVQADADAAGDEPVMLARRLPGVVVAVGPRRDAVGRAVEERLGPRVHVLDDGFQHLRLARDLDLVCLHPDDLRDRPVPAGALREWPSALERGDVFVVWDGPLPRALPAERSFVARRRLDGFVDAAGAPAEAPRRPFLLAGIAHPERFAADIERLCGVPAGTSFHPDHHRFSPAEVESAVRRAQAAGADALVCTEKDLPRLPPVAALPLRALRIGVEVEDAGRLRERVLAVARRLDPQRPVEARA